MFFVYVLKSEVDGRLYKGFTNNLESRLNEHNLGKTKSTKAYRPWKFVLIEKYTNLNEARKREIFLKSGLGRTFLKKILAP